MALVLYPIGVKKLAEAAKATVMIREKGSLAVVSATDSATGTINTAVALFDISSVRIVVVR